MVNRSGGVGVGEIPNGLMVPINFDQPLDFSFLGKGGICSSDDQINCGLVELILSGAEFFDANGDPLSGVSFAPVLEPMSIILFGTVLTGIGFATRRRFSAKPL